MLTPRLRDAAVRAVKNDSQICQLVSGWLGLLVTEKATVETDGARERRTVVSQVLDKVSLRYLGDITHDMSNKQKFGSQLGKRPGL